MKGRSIPAHRHADVVIIGAGISGCATAGELARRGLRVIVLEKDDIGYEASSRNMGAIGILGRHAADLGALSLELWDDLATSLSPDIELEKHGRLCPAYLPRDLPYLESMIKTAANQNIQLEMLDKAEVKRRFPELSENVIAAAYSEQDSKVNPPRVMEGYRALMQDLGVDVESGCLVGDIDVVGGHVRGVSTDSGYFAADAVVVAAGVWSTRLLDRIGMHIPMQYFAIYHGETDPQPPMFDYMLRGPNFALRQFRSGPIRVSGGYRWMGAGHPLSFHDLRDLQFWLPRLFDNRREVEFTVDYRLLLMQLRDLRGSAPVALRQFNPKVPMSRVRSYLKRAKEAIPALTPAHIVRTSGGLIDLTPDHLPVVGPSKQIGGLFLALGFSGQGFSLGPAIGQVMAESVVGIETSIPLTRYRVERFREGGVGKFAHY